MGTSDTVLSVSSADTVVPSGQEGHVLRNPIDTESCFSMLCFKNGSVTRESVRKQAGICNWDEFNSLLDDSPPGNNGNIGLFFLEPEITPKFIHRGSFRFDSTGTKVERFKDKQTEARALIEGQFLSMRCHSQAMGLANPVRVVATGGASANKKFLEILASVFNTPVYVSDVGPNTASLGAAYRALQGHISSQLGKLVPMNSLLHTQDKLAALPDPDHARIYESMLVMYKRLENSIVSGSA